MATGELINANPLIAGNPDDDESMEDLEDAGDRFQDDFDFHDQCADDEDGEAEEPITAAEVFGAYIPFPTIPADTY